VTINILNMSKLTVKIN